MSSLRSCVDQAPTRTWGPIYCNNLQSLHKVIDDPARDRFTPLRVRAIKVAALIWLCYWLSPSRPFPLGCVIDDSGLAAGDRLDEIDYHVLKPLIGHNDERRRRLGPRPDMMYWGKFALERSMRKGFSALLVELTEELEYYESVSSFTRNNWPPDIEKVFGISSLFLRGDLAINRPRLDFAKEMSVTANALPWYHQHMPGAFNLHHADNQEAENVNAGG